MVAAGGAPADVPPRTVAAFAKRFWQIVCEGHSVIGLLPGCYDGWLLDSEGIVRDPFTRSERVAALGLTLSINFVARYITLMVVETRRSKALVAKLPRVLEEWWDTIIEFILGQVVNRIVGGDAVKQILQETYNVPAASAASRRKSNLAMLYCVACTALTTLLAVVNRHRPRVRQTITDTMAVSPDSGLVQDALLIEPAGTLLCVYVSYLTRKPFMGISYAKRSFEDAPDGGTP